MIVVAAVDRSDRAERVVREAVSVGEAFDATPHVVHVLSRSRFVELELSETHRTGRAVDLDRVREYAADVAEEAAAAAGVEGGVETVGLVGDPPETILEYAADRDARFVLVSSRQRTATGKLLFGSVTQSILLDADRSVIAVPPRESREPDAE